MEIFTGSSSAFDLPETAFLHTQEGHYRFYRWSDDEGSDHMRAIHIGGTMAEISFASPNGNAAKVYREARTALIQELSMEFGRRKDGKRSSAIAQEIHNKT